MTALYSIHQLSTVHTFGAALHLLIISSNTGLMSGMEIMHKFLPEDFLPDLPCMFMFFYNGKIHWQVSQ